MFRLIPLWLLAVLILVASPAQAQQKAKPKKQLVFVDFVVMSEGHGLKERAAYDAKADPIAARYGIKRFASLDIVQNVVSQNFRPVRLDLWLLPSPQALSAWSKDPDYKALLPYRNCVHDMKALTLYFAVPALPLRKVKKAHYMIELQTMGPGFDAKTFAAYEKKSDLIAELYAVRRVAALSLSKKIIGAGPSGQRLNVWYLPNEGNFKAWGNNKDFKALVPVRQKLFDMSTYTMLIARGRPNP